MNLNRFPSVDKRPLDLYKLKKAVAQRGGFEKVCKLKKWAEIGRDLGYSGKIMSSLSTSLKNSYQRWLHPYEEYLKLAKPGVQQQLEFEHGGPFTPPSASQIIKDPQHGTPNGIPPGMRDESPAMRASAALNASLKEGDEPRDAVPSPVPEPSRPIASSGFTPVNAGGWNPVNLTPASYQAVNGPPPIPIPKRESENGVFTWPTQIQSAGHAPLAKDLPDYLNAAPLTNGHSPHSSNPLKRSISHDSLNGTPGTESGIGGEGDDASERRSKRVKKGAYQEHQLLHDCKLVSICNFADSVAAPTVVGSHMSLLRPATPRLAGDRKIGKPGEVSA